VHLQGPMCARIAGLFRLKPLSTRGESLQSYDLSGNPLLGLIMILLIKGDASGSTHRMPEFNRVVLFSSGIVVGDESSL